ncbi:cobalamin-dependent protein, partial [Candidatus Bipolaricaulota bacterium]|nr:cobalamin-dependent protein [Candidatus Bipolaricaulota bacterium]
CLPHLERLHEQTHQSTMLSLFSGQHAIVMEICGNINLQVSIARGEIMPFHCAASGKAILAFLPPNEQERILDSIDYHVFTEDTVTDPEALRAELQRVHETGVAYNVRHFHPNTIAVASPIFVRESVVAGSLAIVANADEVAEASMGLYAELLLKTSMAVTEELGGEFPAWLEERPAVPGRRLRRIGEHTQNEAREALYTHDSDKAVRIVEEIHERGGDALGLLDEVFIPLIKEVGDKFGRGDIYLPELIMVAEVMQAVTEKVVEFLPEGAHRQGKKGIAVVGTVEGDVHDIGKTLVMTMLDVNGFEVFDLGRDVPARRLVQKAREVSADIIASSALLSTSMSAQRSIEELLAASGLKGKIKTMIGGAPVTQRWAETIGADAYGQDAAEAVVKACELSGRF